MELQRVQPALGYDRAHGLRARVHEHADLGDERRQGADDLRGSGGGDVALAALEEHEAQRVRSGLDGGERVGQSGDTADFDLGAHGYLMK